MDRMCPECEAGKHDNCAGFIYDEHDIEQPCGCPRCRTEFLVEEGMA